MLQENLIEYYRVHKRSLSIYEKIHIDIKKERQHLIENRSDSILILIRIESASIRILFKILPVIKA